MILKISFMEFSMYNVKLLNFAQQFFHGKFPQKYIFKTFPRLKQKKSIPTARCTLHCTEVIQIYRAGR